MHVRIPVGSTPVLSLCISSAAALFIQRDRVSVLDFLRRRSRRRVMEILLVRNEGEEKRQVYSIGAHTTVEDLTRAIQITLNLESTEFSLGFVHKNEEDLRTLGLTQGSTITIRERTVPISLDFSGFDAAETGLGDLNENFRAGIVIPQVGSSNQGAALTEFTGLGNSDKENLEIGSIFPQCVSTYQYTAHGEFTGVEDLTGNPDTGSIFPLAVTANQDAALGELTGVGDLHGNLEAGFIIPQGDTTNQNAALGGFGVLHGNEAGFVIPQGDNANQNAAIAELTRNPSQGPSCGAGQQGDVAANAEGTQVHADKASSGNKTEKEKLFTEKIEWFEANHIISQMEYEREDTNKKILTPKIKVRILSGFAYNGFDVEGRWVFGVDLYVNLCDTLEALRSQLKMEPRLPLPPAFTFSRLNTHSRISENLSLFESGIRDGDVIVLCLPQTWSVKIFLGMEDDTFELKVNPLTTVDELKETLSQSTAAANLPRDYCLTNHASVPLEGARSLESQLQEGEPVWVNYYL